MSEIADQVPMVQIPMKYAKWVGIALVISMILMIALPLIIISIEPPIDVIGAILPTPYPTTYAGYVGWLLNMIPYQLSWHEPLMTLWFYSVYVFFIIFGAQYTRLVEFVDGGGVNGSNH